MNVVLNILDTIASVLGVIPRTWSLVVGILGPFGMFLFLGGFFGLLITFLWFFFRYLDQKRLVLPTFVFTVFFLVFLSGNILMIAYDKNPDSSAQLAKTEAVNTEETVV